MIVRPIYSSLWILGLILVCAFYQSVEAQYYFGRNKVQYDAFEWQSLSTEHFHIYYYRGEDTVARAAAQFAEEAYRRLEQVFVHPIEESIPLVVYSNHIHFQQTNVVLSYIPEGVGGFFEFMKRRVVLPYLGSMDQFQHVVNHELVHVFMHHKTWAAIRDIRTPEIPSIPLWFTEGLAESWSAGWDSQAELIIRDAVLHDYLLPLSSYSLLSSGFLLYKEGQAFLNWYQQNYSADRLRVLLETYWQYEDFESALGGVTGKPFADLEADWRQALKKRFAQDLAGQDLITSGMRQLTHQGSNIRATIFPDSTDSGRFLYITSRNGYLDVYAQDLKSGEEHPVLHGERDSERESLHFLRTGIHVNAKGQVVYAAKQGPRDALRIFDPSTGRDILTLQNPKLVTMTSPRWSPGGNRVVFAAQDFSGISDIYLWDLQADQLLRLTHDLYADQDPCFGPTGRQIVFSSDRLNPQISESRNLFLLNLDDQTLRTLTRDPYRNTQPVWDFADPGRILYLSDAGGTANVWELKIDEDSTVGWTREARSNLHTGIEAFAVQNADTLLATIFQDYGFQIRQVPLRSTVSVDTLGPGRMLHAAGNWDLGGMDLRHSHQPVPYKLRYSLDFAQAAVANDPIFGFQGGAQLGISDLLGNRYFNFLIDNTAQTSSDFLSSFNLAVTMVDLTHRANRAFSAFRFANDYFDPYQGFFFEEAIGARTALNYPADVFNRLEFSTSLWHSHKEFVFEEGQDALLNSSFIAYVHDNTLWTYTGPLDGWRLRVMAGPTFNFTNSSFHNYTALLDLRSYWRLRPSLSFAQRSMFWTNAGTDIRRSYIGGSWGLRGYRIQEVYGRQYFMLNQELRFPFAERFSLGFRKFDLGVAPVRGAVFLDAGNAWDEEYPGLIGSMGFGLRGLFMGGLVLRLDMGRRTDFHSLDRDWFFQFFFGWDY